MSQTQGHGEDYTAQINKQCQEDAIKLDEDLAKNEAEVVERLISFVSDIKPEVSFRSSLISFTSGIKIKTLGYLCINPQIILYAIDLESNALTSYHFNPNLLAWGRGL